MTTKLLPFYLLLFSFKFAFCAFNLYKTLPDYYADTVMVYKDSILDRVIINDFNGGEITSKYYSNKNVLLYTTQTAFDTNGICLSRINYTNGLITNRDTSILFDNGYISISISTVLSISSSNDTTFYYDTGYSWSKLYDFIGGIYLPESTQYYGNIQKFSYLLDTIDGFYRIWTKGDPLMDTSYIEFDTVTLQFVRSYKVNTGGFIRLTEGEYVDGKPSNSLSIEGYGTNLYTSRHTFVYRYKNTAVNVYISKKYRQRLAENTTIVDLLGRKININKLIFSINKGRKVFIK